MSVLKDLEARRDVVIECPSCGEAFPASQANLFDALLPLPGGARAALEKLEEGVRQGRKDLREETRKLKERARKGAEAVGIGTVVEKLAPSLPGFPAKAEDCRSLFQPIDYIVFRGLSDRGVVEAVEFVDVKSGRARLTGVQTDIRRAVERGRVGFEVVSAGKTGD